MSGSKTDKDWYPSIYTVFWPEQTVYVCERHLEKLKGVAQAIGMSEPVSRNVWTEESGNECGNCINELQKLRKEQEEQGND